MGWVAEFPDVVFGIGRHHRSHTLRDITLAWSRLSYSGPVAEGASVDEVLRAAVATGARQCVVQRAGHVLVDSLDVRARGIVEDILRRAWEGDAAVAGQFVDDGANAVSLSDRLLLVDLHRFEQLGFPSFEGELVARCRQAGLPVVDLGPVVAGRTLDLRGPSACEDAFMRLHGRSIPADDHLPELTDDQRAFLGSIREQVASARRGVFLWNLEPYDEVIVASQTFPGPIGSLYSVASGFKPNMLLHLHGFTSATRVVFFDYSPAALTVRRWLVEHWDGRDFPALLPRLAAAFPPSKVYYQMPGGEADSALSEATVEMAWRRELERWGGARAFSDHWERYRLLPHEYVDCNLLDDARPLLCRMRDDHGVIWWSNAFFTVHGNWLCSPTRRRERFEHLIASLGAMAPDLLLYGSDDNNVCINCTTAQDYRDRYAAALVSDARPLATGGVRITT